MKKHMRSFTPRMSWLYGFLTSSLLHDFARRASARWFAEAQARANVAFGKATVENDAVLAVLVVLLACYLVVWFPPASGGTEKNAE